jgi:hypothetical protein
MTERDHPEADPENHLDKDDVKRAEKETHEDSNLACNDEDCHIPDTELTHIKPDESAVQNDPTAGKSVSSRTGVEEDAAG